jgi:hypothetical protein
VCLAPVPSPDRAGNVRDIRCIGIGITGPDGDPGSCLRAGESACGPAPPRTHGIAGGRLFLPSSPKVVPFYCILRALYSIQA